MKAAAASDFGRLPLRRFDRLQHPVYQRRFKANIVTGFFTLDPLVLQNFFALSDEFSIERTLGEQWIRFGGFGHLGISGLSQKEGLWI